MKAAFKAGKERFEVRQVDVPEMGADECLVRVHYCAICVWCYREWQRDGTNDIYGPGVTAVNGLLVARQFDARPDLVATTLLLTTLGSLVTMSVLLGLLA